MYWSFGKPGFKEATGKVHERMAGDMLALSEALNDELMVLRDKLDLCSQAGFIGSPDGERVLKLNARFTPQLTCEFFDIDKTGRLLHAERIDMATHLKKETYVHLSSLDFDPTSETHGKWCYTGDPQEVINKLCMWEACADTLIDHVIDKASQLRVNGVPGCDNQVIVTNEAGFGTAVIDLEGEVSRHAAINVMADRAIEGYDRDKFLSGSKDAFNDATLWVWRNAAPQYLREITAASQVVREERAAQAQHQTERCGFDTSKWDVQADNDMQFGN